MGHMGGGVGERKRDMGKERGQERERPSELPATLEWRNLYPSRMFNPVTPPGDPSRSCSPTATAQETLSESH